MKENISIFDFELNQDDMNEIKSLDGKKSLFFYHQDVFDGQILILSYMKEENNFKSMVYSLYV